METVDNGFSEFFDDAVGIRAGWGARVWDLGLSVDSCC